MTDDLFADFDPAEIAAINKAATAERVQAGQVRAMRAKHRHQLRRANAEKNLAGVLPARIDAGDSWHCISRGDIDSLSYLRHLLNGLPHLDLVVMSTWCIAKPDLEEIAAWLDSGRIDAFELYAGEIFPSQYGDEYETCLKLCNTYGIKLCIARNHSKVTLAGCAEANAWLVIESSANVNTNPRIEQTAIHHDRALFDFYRDFFHGIRSIDRDRPRHTG